MTYTFLGVNLTHSELTKSIIYIVIFRIFFNFSNKLGGNGIILSLFLLPITFNIELLKINI